MTKHRMKCAVDEKQIANRLAYAPEIIELHLLEEDLIGDKKDSLCRTIEMLQNNGITVYLHHPMKHGEHMLDILSKDPFMSHYYQQSTKILYELCRMYRIQCVIHCHYAGTESSKVVSKEKTIEMKRAVEAILSYGEDVFLWENTVEGIFSFDNPYLLDHLIAPLNLPLVHDISHTFICVQGDNEALLTIAKSIDPYVKYLHVVDSMGTTHDGLELSLGNVQWELLIPYINEKPSIYEIVLADYCDAQPMARSASYLETLMTF